MNYKFKRPKIYYQPVILTCDTDKETFYFEAIRINDSEYKIPEQIFLNPDFNSIKNENDINFTYQRPDESQGTFDASDTKDLTEFTQKTLYYQSSPNGQFTTNPKIEIEKDCLLSQIVQPQNWNSMNVPEAHINYSPFYLKKGTYTIPFTHNDFQYVSINDLIIFEPYSNWK